MLQKPWFDSLEECIKETNPEPRVLEASQLDDRK